MDVRAGDDTVGFGLGVGWVAVGIAVVCYIVWVDLQKCVSCRGGEHFLKIACKHKACNGKLDKEITSWRM